MERIGTRHIRRRATLTTVSAVVLGACGPNATPSPDRPSEFGITEVFDEHGASLGSVALRVECAPNANTHVLRGLALLHNMTYTEAESAFRDAVGRDPDCAFGYWGQAMTFVHPLWPDVPTDDQLVRGWTLLQTAREHGLDSPTEVSYVEALEAYYADGTERGEQERLADFAAAWARVAANRPDDPEAQLFKSLSLIATAPGSDPTFARQIEAGQLATKVLDRIPDHPGAHHYVIHAYDLPPLAERALGAARSYGAVAPENAHALHMTSHIFTRLGLWEESIEFNRRSADAALSHPINGATSHHHLHALDYLAYAHLQRADVEKAREIASHLATLSGPVADNPVSAYAFAAIPARIVLETKDWPAAARLSPRWPERLTWDRYPHLEAIPVFALGLGAARTGDLGAAEAAVERLEALQKRAAELPESYDWGTQVQIQALGARAWLAYGRGNRDTALSLMRQAAALESTAQKNPVTPSEVLPAGELLGDMLAAMGRNTEAFEAYRAALTRSPNRLNSLFGAGRAAELEGDAPTARQYYNQLARVIADPDATLPEVTHAMAFLARDAQRSGEAP